MTDKQLAYTLRLLTIGLRTEFSNIRDALSEPIQVREIKNFLGGVTISYPALDGLDELIGNLEQSIKHLETEAKSG